MSGEVTLTAKVPLYIFDLDGTLARIEHRLHFIKRESPDWDGFYQACFNDEPNTPVIRTLCALKASGADVWVWSGRSDVVRKQTLGWLRWHVGYAKVDWVEMRSDGDYTPDDKLKRTWYGRMLVEDQQRLVATFDDRDRMVRMWRSLNITCYQVAEGAF